jgi:hypothetical protein
VYAPSAPADVLGDATPLRHIGANAYVDAEGAGCTSIFFELDKPPPKEQHKIVDELHAITSAEFCLNLDGAPGISRRAGYLLKLQDRQRTEKFSLLTNRVRRILERNSESFSDIDSVEHLISEWSERATREPLSSEHVTQLWGELHVLSLVPRAALGLKTWVNPLSRTHQFEAGEIRLNVKTARQQRTSTFEFQLGAGSSDAAATHTAFVKLQPNADKGRTLDELIERLARRLDDSRDLEWALLKAGYQSGQRMTERYTVAFSGVTPNELMPRPSWDDVIICSVIYSADIEKFGYKLAPIEPTLAELAEQAAR